MEQSSNGKFKETQKVEPQEQDKKVATEVVEHLKPENVSVRGIIIDSQLVKETRDDHDLRSDSSNYMEEEEEIIDKSLQPEVSGAIEEGKEVINSVIESAELIVPTPGESMISVETLVEKSNDLGVTEVEMKELLEEKILPSLNADEVGPIVIDVLLNEQPEETSSLLQSLNGTGEDVSEGVLSATEQIELLPPKEKDGLSPVESDVVSKGVDKNLLSSVDENGRIPPALTDVSKGVDEAKEAALEGNTGESPGIVDKEYVDNVDASPKPLANATIVGSNDAFPESIGNPPSISMSQRTPQQTSWRSCCGLFEILRRSDG